DRAVRPRTRAHRRPRPIGYPSGIELRTALGSSVPRIAGSLQRQQHRLRDRKSAREARRDRYERDRVAGETRRNDGRHGPDSLRVEIAQTYEPEERRRIETGDEERRDVAGRSAARGQIHRLTGRRVRRIDLEIEVVQEVKRESAGVVAVRRVGVAADGHVGDRVAVHRTPRSRRGDAGRRRAEQVVVQFAVETVEESAARSGIEESMAAVVADEQVVETVAIDVADDGEARSEPELGAVPGSKQGPVRTRVELSLAAVGITDDQIGDPVAVEVAGPARGGAEEPAASP